MATIDVFNPARDVLNQAPPLQPLNLFETDLALVEAAQAAGALLIVVTPTNYFCCGGCMMARRRA